MNNTAQLTDFQIIHQIRQIEASPSSHRSWKVQEMVEQNLNNLRTEATRRGLTV